MQYIRTRTRIRSTLSTQPSLYKLKLCCCSSCCCCCSCCFISFDCCCFVSVLRSVWVFCFNTIFTFKEQNVNNNRKSLKKREENNYNYNNNTNHLFKWEKSIKLIKSLKLKKKEKKIQSNSHHKECNKNTFFCKQWRTMFAY